MLAIVLIGNQAINAQTKWAVDKNHTDIRFTAIHMVISEVSGEFKEFDGSVISNSDDFDGAEVEFVAQTASLSTDQERRDTHLKSDDFFNAETYPEIKFNGKIEKEGDKHYLVGEFTMRDVTKPIKFDVTYNGQIPGRRGRKAGFKITGSVDRYEYGLKWDSTIETGELVVSQEIQITCNVELNEVTDSE
jgi:polyisoprenoid-binding protein YceI